MVELDAQLDATFGALADPTRRSILARLAGDSLTVGEIAEPYSMSLAAVSKHIDVLEKAGLVERHAEGRARRCRMSPTPLTQAENWIEECRAFWTESFDRLEEYVNSLNNEEENQDE